MSTAPAIELLTTVGVLDTRASASHAGHRRSPPTPAVMSAENIDHPLELAGDGVDRVRLQTLGEDVPGVRLDLEMPREPALGDEPQDLAQVVLRRLELAVAVEEDRHVEVD